MRGTLVAFFVFVLAGTLVLPELNTAWEVPSEVTRWAPVAIMLLSLLFQWEMTAWLRRKGTWLSREQELIEQLGARGEQAEAASREKIAEAESHSAKLQQRVEKTEKEKIQLSQALAAAEKAARKPAATGTSDAALQLLSLLQERGRLLDFLMDDVASYSDAQVGAAARVIHQGCSKVLSDYFTIAPLATEAEGAPIAVSGDAELERYELVGGGGSTPCKGTLLHRGWHSTRVALPENHSAALRQGILAQAQVEVTS